VVFALSRRNMPVGDVEVVVVDAVMAVELGTPGKLVKEGACDRSGIDFAVCRVVRVRIGSGCLVVVVAWELGVGRRFWVDSMLFEGSVLVRGLDAV